ncbi:hypothetical protein CJU90_3936 [Yarrowia sp. C11]|nr:hypothetical protein CKK34_5548 [Yarrowia sp. E02]KAG5367635.1 hypothetical protein CJU90_3936 [Yarrowia sp. C11]
MTPTKHNPDATVCPMDLYLKRPAPVTPEEPISFAMPPAPVFESDAETDFDLLSDVEDDYEVNYVRHQSRYDSDTTLCDENDEQEGNQGDEEGNQDNSSPASPDPTSPASPSEYTHYHPQHLPEQRVYQQGKNVRLVRRQYVQSLQPNLDTFQFRLRTPSLNNYEPEALSPSTTYVFTEEIGPSGDDDSSSGDSPDNRDYEDEDDEYDSDTTRVSSCETLVGEDEDMEDVSDTENWFQEKSDDMDVELFY